MRDLRGDAAAHRREFELVDPVEEPLAAAGDERRDVESQFVDVTGSEVLVEHAHAARGAGNAGLSARNKSVSMEFPKGDARC